MTDYVFDVNYEVRIKLTFKGALLYIRYFEQLVGNNPILKKYIPIPAVGEDYVMKIQVWELMQIFGPNMYAGQDKLFSILFNDEELNKITKMDVVK